MEGPKDKAGVEVKVGDTVLVPFTVKKIGGNQRTLLHLESVEAYGHINPSVGGPLKGRTKNALWAEPEQIEVSRA